jgi:8-oxo-dGTP pyrophosphatase MutT (NUDIX family)
VDSSTLLLVRDGATAPADGSGIEVLLLERHLDSDFAGGALVFPGGKVADADRSLSAERWQGRPLAEWCAQLGVEEERDALGLLVAAVRETFEEVGILLAHREGGAPLRAEDLSTSTFRDARARLASRDGHEDWRAWLGEERLVLDLEALVLWSWWVTPVGQHKRFDTRFFIAAAPPGQIAEQDAVEASGVTWMRPQEALDARERGEVTVIFPTRRNLATLAAHPTAEAAITAARAGRVDLRRIMPTVVRREGQVMVQHPFEDEPEPI